MGHLRVCICVCVPILERQDVEIKKRVGRFNTYSTYTVMCTQAVSHKSQTPMNGKENRI